MIKNFNNKNIYILTGPVGSGKTSIVKQWALKNKAVEGFLTPDKNGKRVFMELPSTRVKPFEIGLSEGPAEGIKVGKFIFDKATFDFGKQALRAASNKHPEWLVVDEVGKLELEQNEGFQPELGALIRSYQKEYVDGKLLLIVRDYLLDQCLKQFQLKGAHINEGPWFRQEKPLLGVVICGGKSTRMGSDKSLLNYNGKPQYQYVYDMLDKYCDRTLLSCNAAQVGSFEKSFDTLIDNPDFGDEGPMTAMLSIVEKFPHMNVLAIGIDYPFFGTPQVEKLVQTWKHLSTSVAFGEPNTNLREPMLALYAQKDLMNLLIDFRNGQNSLRKFLDQARALKIDEDAEILKSIDTPEASFEAIKQLKQA